MTMSRSPKSERRMTRIEAPKGDLSLAGVVTEWVRKTPVIRGLALVGSHARGQALPDSDIDFILLTTATDTFRASIGWMDEIDWSGVGNPLVSWRDGVIRRCLVAACFAC